MISWYASCTCVVGEPVDNLYCSRSVYFYINFLSAIILEGMQYEYVTTHMYIMWLMSIVIDWWYIIMKQPGNRNIWHTKVIYCSSLVVGSVVIIIAMCEYTYFFVCRYCCISSVWLIDHHFLQHLIMETYKHHLHHRRLSGIEFICSKEPWNHTSSPSTSSTNK